MLTCCNGFFEPVFLRTLSFSKPYYRRLEYGVCPICGAQKFRDYVRYNDGSDRERIINGKAALKAYEKWIDKITATKYFAISNQNVCYGDFKKTNQIDKNGLPVFLQLRKNFNNQSEVLNVIETRVYRCG